MHRPIAIAVLTLAAGCQSEPPAHDPPIPVADAPTPNSRGAQADRSSAGGRVGPFERRFDGIVFLIPAGWREVELSAAQQGFIDAKLEIPAAGGKVSVTFSSNAGGAESNIQRWIGQFQSPPDDPPQVESIDVDGKPARWAEIGGTFTGGGMAAAEGPVERMLGIAIPLGERDFYLKATGTRSAVLEVRGAFRKFVRAARLTGAK